MSEKYRWDADDHAQYVEKEGKRMTMDQTVDELNQRDRMRELLQTCFDYFNGMSVDNMRRKHGIPSDEPIAWELRKRAEDLIKETEAKP